MSIRITKRRLGRVRIALISASISWTFLGGAAPARAQTAVVADGGPAIRTEDDVVVLATLDGQPALRFDTTNGVYFHVVSGYLLVSATRVAWEPDSTKYKGQAFDVTRTAIGSTERRHSSMGGVSWVRVDVAGKQYNFGVGDDDIQLNWELAALEDFGATLGRFRGLTRGLSIPLTAPQQAVVTAEENTGDAAAAKGELREAFQHYLAAFKSLPELAPKPVEQSLREKIIKLTVQLAPPPAIPQGAVRHSAYAEAAVEEAQKDANASHLDDAVDELETALRIAPWWAQAYFNLGAVLQKANRSGEAAQALQLYLLADPHAANAQDVQMEIYKLQYEAKQQ